MQIFIKQKMANIVYPISFCYTKIQQKIFPIKIISWKETVEKIRKGYSISRFGDGEFNIVLNKSGINFQDIDPQLQNRMRKILLRKINNEKYIVAVTPILQTYKDFKNNHVKFWCTFNLFKRKKIIKLLNAEQKYADALFARGYGTYKFETKEFVLEKFDEIKKIWEDKDLLIIEGEDTKLGVENDLLSRAKSIKRIIIPSKNAFQKYDYILENVLKRDKRHLILIVAGPTATVLAYDLYEAGFQAVDLGQINAAYEEAFKTFNVSYKGNVLDSSEYIKQIIDRIKNDEEYDI